MPDRRENTLDDAFANHGLQNAYREITAKPFRAVLDALDVYMEESVLDAFEFVAKHTTGHRVDEQGSVEFKYKGEWISTQQLFENFL